MENRRTEQAVRESERSARATLDALSASIAILDENVTIVTVNQARRDFADANASKIDGLSEGANYLAVCNTAVGVGARVAKDFAVGIRAVMHGERKMFALEYVVPVSRGCRPL